MVVSAVDILLFFTRQIGIDPITGEEVPIRQLGRAVANLFSRDHRRHEEIGQKSSACRCLVTIKSFEISLGQLCKTGSL